MIKQYAQALTLAHAAGETGVAEKEWSDDQEEEEEEEEPDSPEAEAALLRSRTPKRPKNSRPLYARGSVVWAKIYGFPWWPSQVRSVRSLYDAEHVVFDRADFAGEPANESRPQ